MRKFYLIFATLFLFHWMIAQDVYVSPSGSDDNTGTETSPFLTLQRALDAVSGSAAGKTVWMKGGTYQVNQTITLNAEHSGSEGSPFVVRSVPGETVILTGGIPMPGSLFETVVNADELARIPQVAHGKVMVAQLDESLAGLFPSKDLYNETAAIAWNGYVLQNAQFPNKGYAYFSETIDPGPYTTGGVSPAAYSEENPTGGIFKMRESIDWTMLQAEFDRNKDLLIDGYLNNDWYYQSERVGKIDASKQEIQLLRYTSYGIGGEGKPLKRRFVIKNALSQLDQPGEWYYDRNEMKFYIWPVQPPNSQKAITLLENSRLIDGAKCSNIIIRNLSFQNFGVEGIRLLSGDNILIAGCDFRASNGLGARLGDVINSGVQSCDFSYLSQAFVVGGNEENRKTLTRENNFGRNNHIHHCTKRGYGLVAVSGMGSEFSNNLMHNQNGAYAYSGNDMTIQYNEFYDVGYEMGDWNTIYNNANLSELGNRIRRNFFHHMMETPGGHPLSPARTDDLGAGFHFEENIVYKGGRCATMFQGPDNTVIGNVALETGKLWWTNQEPYDVVDKSTWSTHAEALQDKYDEYLELQQDIKDGKVDFNVKDNKIGKAELIFGTKGWENNELWKAHYPNLSKMFNFLDVNENPWMACHNVIENNYMSGQGSWPFEIHGHNTPMNDITTLRSFFPSGAVVDMPISFTPDDMFEDAANFDFNFKSSFTPVDGFEKWDFDSVGLYIDEYRTSMPDKNAYRMAVKNKYDGIPSSGSRETLDEINDRHEYPEYLSLVSDFAVVSERPVLHWPLDEGVGTVATDIASGAHASWQVGDYPVVPWVVGLIGSGIGSPVMGVGSRYFKASSDTLVNANAATISAWLNISTLASGDVVINNDGWGISIQNGIVQGVCNDVKFDAPSALSLDEWHLLTLTWKNDGAAKLYIDGVVTAEVTDAATTFSDDKRWYFGKVKSKMDDVSVFDIALSQEEIAFVYMNGMRHKGMRDIMPIHVKEISLNPSTFALRVGYSAKLTVEIIPGNATFQNVNWVSSNPSALSVDKFGRITALEEDDVTVTATTVDGGLQAYATITVRNDMTGVVPSPDAYWPFNETEGNVALDVIGGVKANWNGIVDQTWQNGMFSRSATFSGGEQDRFVTESDPLLEATALTVSGWFNLNKTGQYEGLVTSRGDANVNNWGFSAADSKLDVRTAGQAGYVPGMVSAGKWIYVAFTWNNNGERVSYVNGEVVESKSADSSVYVSNNVWYFGDDVCCGGREIDGRIDEVMMYRTALTAEQIKSIYVMGKQGISFQDLTSVWPTSVTFSKETLELKIGESEKLNVEVLPVEATNKTLLWSSLDEGVAIVDAAGLVKAVGLGTTQIIGTTEDVGISDTLDITVVKNPVNSIVLDKDSITLFETKFAVLSASVLPETATDRTFTWNVVNEDIASINIRGEITGLLEGETLIIATSNSNTALKDTCVVIVKAVHVESLTLDKHDLDVASADFVTLVATITPENPKNDNVIWTTSNSDVVSNYGLGVFVALSKGTVTLKAIAEDGGISDSCIVRVDGGVANLDEEFASHGIKLYPNPAQDVVNLSFDDIKDVQKVELYNAMGQIVKQIQVVSHLEEINVSNLVSGCYFIKITVDNKSINAPLVINR